MKLSNLITDYWWGIAIGFSILVLAGSMFLQSQQGRELVDRLKLSFPVIKSIYIQIYLIQMMRIMALSLKSGVNLMEALELCKDVVQNSVFVRFIEDLSNDVIEGRKLAQGFKNSSMIPPIVKQMITTGEETGNLELVSDRIAEYFQSNLEKLLKVMTKSIEPLMLLVMGVVVGVLVSSLILPIFKLSHAVH